MKPRQWPSWAKTGVLIFPLLAITGPVLWLLSGGRVNPLLWAVIPAIIFEEALEGHWRAASDSVPLNLMFLAGFWFLVGSLIGIVGERIRR